MRFGKQFVSVCLVALLAGCCFGISAGLNFKSEEELRASKNIALHSGAVEQAHDAHAVTEQEQIDAIKSAFMKLPNDELDRLGVDTNQNYVAGSEEAEALKSSWTQRQAELKQMMEKQLKAADFMSELAGHLVNSSVPDDEILIHLDNLEQLLADIDNARDFYSIGKWPALTSLLTGITQRSITVQTMAIHCIGTAVKNDYDFQMWVLDPAGGQEEGAGKSVLEILFNTMHAVSEKIIQDIISDDEKKEFDGLLRRIMYTLSAAARGNLDVQAALSTLEVKPNIKFEDLLETCISDPKLSVGLKRKCWHMVSDFLDEMVYIRHDVAQEYAAIQQQNVDAVGERDVVADVANIIKSMHPIGEIFLSPDYHWILLAEDMAGQIASMCDGPNDEKTTVCGNANDSDMRDIFEHILNVKKIIRSEFIGELNNIEVDGLPNGIGSEQMKKLKAVEDRYKSVVEAFLRQPLMQQSDELY